MAEDAQSVGDVLRTVNDLFKNDFLLVRGDIITNIDIHPALKMHYHVQTMESDKKNMTPDVRKFRTILTKLFIKMPSSNPVRDP